MEAIQIAQDIAVNEARVNVTFGGQNGELPDPVMFDATDGDIRGFVSEALRNGSIPGVPAALNPDLADFKIDRYGPTEARAYNLIQVRPKTEFG
jgi:hypothetical protein